MDRYGYDTYDSHAYCIIDRKNKHTHIATAFHVTVADKIVKALNDAEKDIERGRQMAVAKKNLAEMQERAGFPQWFIDSRKRDDRPVD